MPRQLVHREELGRLIAHTSGAITMIDDSHYDVDRYLVTTLIPLLQSNMDGLAHVQIMLLTMPSASIFTQLNIIEAPHFNPLNETVS